MRRQAIPDDEDLAEVTHEMPNDQVLTPRSMIQDPPEDLALGRVIPPITER
jgi:hypothetical protein